MKNLYAVVGFMQEAVHQLKPDLMLNLLAPTGDTMHVLSSALNKAYGEYTTLYAKALHSLPVSERPGKFDYMVTNDQIHVLGFINHGDNAQRSGFQKRNLELTAIMVGIANQVKQSNVKTVMIPYVGIGVSGYNLNEWMSLMDGLFGDDVTVYMPTTRQYAINFPEEMRLEYDKQETEQPVNYPRKKIIHWQQNMGSANPYNYHPA